MEKNFILDKVNELNDEELKFIYVYYNQYANDLIKKILHKEITDLALKKYKDELISVAIKNLIIFSTEELINGLKDYVNEISIKNITNDNSLTLYSDFLIEIRKKKEEKNNIVMESEKLCKNTKRLYELYKLKMKKIIYLN